MLGGIDAIHLHPLHELRMIDDILLEGVTHLIDEIHMHVRLVGVHFTTTLIDGQEYWLDATCRLCHQRRSTRRCNGQTGDVSPSVLHHIFVQLRVSLLQAQDEGVFLLTLDIEYLEGSTLHGHLHTRAVGVQCQRLVNLNREVGSLLSAITQPHGGYHVTLGSDTYTCTATHAALLFDFLPQMTLSTLHLY